MPHIPFHPAPGFGDLLPGSFVVPQNPIRDAGTPMVPSVQAAAGNQPVKIPKLGDLLPGMFVVPQNPLMAAVLSQSVTTPSPAAGKKAVAAMSGLDCGCGGGCGGRCGCGGGIPAGWGGTGMTGMSGDGLGTFLWGSRSLSGYDPLARNFSDYGWPDLDVMDGAIVNIPGRANARMFPRYDLKRFESYGYTPAGMPAMSGLRGLGASADPGLSADITNLGLMAGITTWLQAPSSLLTGISASLAIPNWALWGAVGLGAYLLIAPGGSEYRQMRGQYRGYRRLAKRVANPRKRRNIAAGYYDDEEGIFHPIRASYDYSPSRAGEKKRRKR